MGGKKKRDLYDALGVDRGASTAEVKSAYRRRAKQSHPDVGGSAEEFAAVSHAALVLSDPVRRERYDRAGDAEVEPDQEKARVLSLIAEMLGQIVADDRIDHTKMDLVNLLKSALSHGIDDHKKKQVILSARLRRAEKIAGRFKSRKGADVLGPMMVSMIAGLRKAEAELLGAIGDHQAALEIVGNHSFRRDLEQRVHQRGFVFTTMSGVISSMPTA